MEKLEPGIRYILRDVPLNSKLSSLRPSAACIVAGLAVWVLATLLITALTWRSFGPNRPVVAYLIYSAASAFIPCIGIGVPSTAIALWLRSRHPARQALTGALVTATIGFAIFVMALGAGTGAISGIAPMLLILAAELWLAFKLRTRRTRPNAA